MVLVAIFSDGHAFDKLHDEIRSARWSRAAVEYLGNVRMIHNRQCLPLGLEARHNLSSIHAGLENLERHFAPHWFCLFRKVDNTEPALTNLFQKLVWSN